MISFFQASRGGRDGGKVVFGEDLPAHRDTKGAIAPRRATVYGRDSDTDAVKGLLFGPGAGGVNSSVVTVVGIGGIGKTTFARHVYNDPEVSSRFEGKVWFDVSDAGLVAQVAAGDDPDAREDIRVAIGGKRLLVVLDDVWDNSIEQLDRFRRIWLGEAAEGSKIMITTRSDGVAGYLGGDGGEVYHLEGLSDEDCWKLFKQRAFSAVKEETQQLERIGKEIVGKFQGVPLTAIAIGSLLRFETDRSSWERVRDSEIWELPEVAKKTLSALKLSYDHLPPHLQRCFEYCSLFPKFHNIDREKLVDLWVAEGLTSMPAAGAVTEDVGDGYFNDLLLRSFFQAEDKEVTYETIYKMHDLFHDLAQSIVGYEHSTVVADGAPRSVPDGCRRLVVLCAWQTSAISEHLYRSKRLETFVLLMRDTWLDSTYKCSLDELPSGLFSSLKYLRLLDLSCIRISELPSSISKLKNLSYLNLSGTEIETLPKSIGRLKNLSILKLKSCQKLQSLPHSIKKLRSLKVLDLDWCLLLQELPEGICNLCNLTHLQIDKCILLTCLPKGIGKLAGLQILSQFPLDEEQGSTIAELQHLNLRGKIYIRNLGNLSNPMDARRGNMKEKHQLRHLELHWNLDYSGEKVNWVAGYSEDDGQTVLEGLQPHPNLEELAIGGYWGTKFPTWMAPMTIQSSLVNLVKITLSCFGVCEALPPLGELPSLKILEIAYFDALKHLNGEFYGSGTFPSLEVFEISHMHALEEWILAVDGRDVFPRLTHLKIERCPRLTALPHLPCLDVLALSKTSEELLSSGSRGAWNFPSLKDLCISNCEASSGWDGLLSLTAVETLTITHCGVSSIPDGVQQLTSLRNLIIHHLHNLAALPVWLAKFTSLQSLKIHFCPKLANLLESVQDLPSLRNLEVRGDSNMWDQHMIGGDDWKDQYDVSHIPNIRFEAWDDQQEWTGALTGKSYL